MLLPIIWVVALMGCLSLIIGAVRITSPKKYADGLAAKAGREKSNGEDLRKAKSSGIALVIISVVMLGIASYVQFFMDL
jgi:purine-cytosine permease-like protein